MTMHRVEEGQRLSEIAAKYGTTTDQIVSANPTKEAVTLASGEQVFASLAAGEDIELPGVLGAAESPYPRRFYEQAFDALHATLSMNLKDQATLDQVAQAAAYMKSAVTYLQTHPVTSSKYKGQDDAVAYSKTIITSIDTLDSILRGNAFMGANYYVMLGNTLKQLGNEMDKWPKPATSTIDFVFRNWKPSTPPTGAPTGQFPAGATPTGQFPPQNATWGGPIRTKIPVSTDTQAGDPATEPATACPDGTFFDRATGSCIPNTSGPDWRRAGDADATKQQAELLRQKAEAEKAAAAAASTSKTKKVLIVAGSVVALGLAGFGAWHMFAKDKNDAEKKPTP